MTNTEAIETLRANYPDACFEQLREAINKAVKALEEPKWIPCSERLPEKCGVYLVSGGSRVWLCELVQIMTVYGWTNDARNPVVTAWMPLPEPYKGKE